MLLIVKTTSETYSVSFGEINGIETTETPVCSAVGKLVGRVVGKGVGPKVSEVVGSSVGERVGPNVGERVGPTVGERVGPTEGELVGSTVMLLVEHIRLEKKATTNNGSKVRNFIAVLFRVKLQW